MAELTVERLRQILDYEPQTGLFKWRERVARCVRIGDVAGCREKRIGYVTIGIDGDVYKAHRLAWLFVTGVWPKKYIDHINGVKHDNRFENLREVFEDGNSQNVRKPNKRNKSGFIGVIRFQNRWRASITVNKKTKYIGDYDTPEEAHQAYLTAKRHYHKACTI